MLKLPHPTTPLPPHSLTHTHLRVALKNTVFSNHLSENPSFLSPLGSDPAAVMVRYVKHCHLVAFGFHQVRLKVIIEINGIEVRTHK